MVKNKNYLSLFLTLDGACSEICWPKCEIQGGILVKVEPEYTTQDCSSCGERVKKSLIRTHVCKKCGTVLDLTTMPA